MTGPAALGPEQERLQRDYRPAFLRYLARGDEPARHAGYVLGRTAVSRRASLLDLVAAHHVTLLEVLPDARDPREAAAMSSAAAEFLTEVLASFSMAGAAVDDLREELTRAQREIARLQARSAPASGHEPAGHEPAGHEPAGQEPV